MLLAFEAAAKSLSFTQAGRELSLTQSAISHQIQALEETLGLQLFDRVRQRLQLTGAGHLLLSRLVPSLNALEGALLETMASRDAGATLHVAVVPTFASKWLIPRLPDFVANHPDITLNLVTRIDRFDFAESRFDAAVYFGEPVWSQAQCDRLTAGETIVVCSPAMADQVLRSASDLANVTLLHLRTRVVAWSDWAANAGVPGLDTTRGPRFELFSMVAQAAAAGLGAAVLPRILILDELESGKLVSPFGPAFASDREAYCLARPDTHAALPAVLSFRAWLLRQAQL